MIKAAKAHWVAVARSILISMGALWLPIEAYEGLSNAEAELPYWAFVVMSVIVGAGLFLVDGYFLTGFLKSRVQITSNSFDTKVRITFGDLFAQKGWKAVAVNDFFDSIVDGDLVAPESLHGHVINNYWPDNRDDWQKQIRASIKAEPIEKVERAKGNERRYPIGTTGTATNGGQKMLFVALGKTDASNNVTSASAESLVCAVRGLLQKARVVCANEPLYIPLMGSGLARVGIKNAILADLILAAIFEETKQSKVTSSITILLPNEKRSEINLASLSRDWS